MQILEMFILLLFQWAIQLCKQAAVENIGTNSIVMINNHFYKFWFLFLNVSTKRFFCYYYYYCNFCGIIIIIVVFITLPIYLFSDLN